MPPFFLSFSFGVCGAGGPAIPHRAGAKEDD
nr:MAG TPA: hypothetical protein [Caudoviricetes sp.]